MYDYEYLIKTFTGILLITSGLLAIAEKNTSSDSPWRIRFGRIHKFFTGESVQNAPTRAIERYKRLMFRAHADGASQRFLRFIFIVDGALLVPLHSYRTLPHPSPTWEFALNPFVYYFVTVGLIIAFLRSSLRMLKSKGNSLDFWLVMAFVILCNNVLMMHVHFLFASKAPLLTEGFGEPNALLYLDALLGRKWALAVFMIIVGTSAYYMVSFLIMILSLGLNVPDYIAAGLARHISLMTVLISLHFLVIYLLDPEFGFPNPPSLSMYLFCVAFAVGMSVCFLVATSRLKHRTATSTIALILIPAVSYFLLKMSLGDLADVAQGRFAVLVFATIFAPIFVSYVVVTFSGIASLSAKAGALIFGNEDAEETPFATLAFFLSFASGILTFLFFQFSYYAN